MASEMVTRTRFYCLVTEARVCGQLVRRWFRNCGGQHRRRSRGDRRI